MWKKAFVALLSVNLLIIVGFTLWWGSLPKASQVQQKVNTVASGDRVATGQIAIGDDAINAYLEYAVPEQPDMAKVLSYARVKFADKWELQVGLRLSDRVVPCDIVCQPTIADGNLGLQVESATIGEVPLPTSTIFLLLKHVPWPDWIQVDANASVLHLNFTDRPQHPYGIQILNYSPATRMVTLRASIVPKALLQR